MVRNRRRGAHPTATLLVLAWLLAACGTPASAPSTGTTAPAPARSSSPAVRAQDNAQDNAEEDAQENAQGNGIAVPPLPDLTRTPPTARPSGPPLTGADAGWPQCPKGMGIEFKRTQGAPMPLPEARFVILGVTNGPSFSANPCLAQQVDWARRRGLRVGAYAVVSHPGAKGLAALGDRGPFDGRTRRGALANAGYQAAHFDLATMQRAGLRVPAVWVDVEPVPHYDWGPDVAGNAAVVRGAVRGFVDAGLRVGVYSTPALWKRVVGDLRLGLPEWRAAGRTTRAEAMRRCAADWSFQGGSAVLGQWVEDGRDHDRTCPGAASRLSRWLVEP